MLSSNLFAHSSVLVSDYYALHTLSLDSQFVRFSSKFLLHKIDGSGKEAQIDSLDGAAS